MGCSPLVVIGLPFYNDARTLQDAIRSVFAQTVEDWRLLLLDDGSSDGSLDIAKAVRDERVSVLTDGQNRGLAYRLNQATHLTNSRYLARFDADDLMHHQRLERQLAFLEANPGINLVGTAAFIVDAETKPMGVRRVDAPSDLSVRSIIERGMFIHPTVMGRIEWFRRNLYSLDFPRAEDSELWGRLRSYEDLANLDVPLYFYRDPIPMNLDKYLANSRSLRRVIRKHGPSAVGPRFTKYLLARVLAKEWLYRSIGTGIVQRYLINRRHKGLSSQQYLEASSEVAKLLQTEVPGFVPPA